MRPRITVAICTWNRAQLLARTLERLSTIEQPADSTWELLVVNNACTDETDLVLESFKDRLPLNRLYEPVPGLSRARNLAVNAATGDYIVWTDDDVLVSRVWLQEYLAAFRRFPEAVLFGGPVRPDFEAEPPAWLTRVWSEASIYYAVRDCDEQAQRIHPEYVPFGANFALRMDVQRRHLYPLHLGRRGTLLISGEECEVMWAVLREGGIGYWVPHAIVEHWLPLERLTMDHVRERIQCEGEVDARPGPADRLNVLGRPLKLWRELVTAELLFRVHRLVSKPEVWFPYLRRASFLRGRFRGYRTNAPRTV
jgi:glycosyltransferase involved in cell wall biosynthesis